MAKFVELTGVEFGKNITINVDSIISFSLNNTGNVIILMSSEYKFGVQESYEEVKKLLGVE